MLHKRFKPAKCKTSLKLATSRIKLMRNKKGVQINQMKRDLAQLLETGQDRTARIRVEHVIREEKMVAAYDLIEIYCELIVARLPIIESQKTCPVDLKEAITSVIFAAPRCSDISELSDIRKQFTAKYGKDFVSGAIELRPDCGVSRMLVEKLSAVAPDLQTKIKVLSGVAKDHNIEWDPTTIEEEETKPPSDLLNGPANFENVSMANADPLKIQPMKIHEEKQNATVDFSEQNRKYTLSTQNVTSTDNGGETSSSGMASERMEMRQNWNMEFKDASSAAEAAAESAERAAMAARAAAHFSSHEKIANHHPTGPYIRDKTPRVSEDDRKPNILNQHVNRTEHDTSQKATETFDMPSYRSNTGSSGPTSLRSDNDLIKNEKLVNNFHMTDGYFEESLHEDKESPFSPERESKTELVSGQKESYETENINFFATKKQPSIRSSHSHSSTSSDELEVGKKTVVGNPFAVVDQESPFKETTKTSSNVVVDDDHDGGGGPKFDTGFDYDEIESTHSLENAHIWSPRMNTVDQPNSQSRIFSESLSFGDHSVKSMEPDNHEPASFDHSDGQDSESESESSYVNSRKTRIELNDLVEVGPSFDNPEDYEEKHNLDQESYDNILEDNVDSLNQRLNFGTLTGGLRNKGGIRLPPYTKSTTIEKSTEESFTTRGQKSVQSSLDSGVSKMEDKKRNVFMSISDSDSDSDTDEKESKQPNTRSLFSPPVAFFNDDGTESEDEVSKQVPSRVRLGSGLSRRTRGSPSVAYSKTHVEPKPDLKTVVPAEPLAYARRFKEEGAKQFSASQPPFRPSRKMVETESTTLESRVNHAVNTKQETVKTMPESKNPTHEHIPQRIAVESGKSKNAETPNLGSENFSGENLVKKPSHVHPKLPEYDSIAARLQSMRTDRQ